MKKVMIIANSYKTIYNFRLELIQKLVDSNNEVILVIPKDKNNSMFNSYPIKILEISLSRFGLNPFKEFFLISRLLNYINAYKPDVIFSFTIKPNIYTGIIKSLFNFKFSFFPTITGLGNTSQKLFFSFFFFFLYKLSFLKANKVFFQNSKNLDLFVSRKIIHIDNVVLVNGSGINLKHYSYHEPNKRTNVKFLMVSRLRKDKGVDEFLSVAKIISETYPNVFFGLAGWIEDKKYQKILNSFIKRKNFVYFGELTQEEVKFKIIDFDCLIHPSHHEGMSNVLLEASALGRPSIVSDIPGCNDIIQNGVNGFLFQVKNQGDLLSKINLYLDLDQSQTKLMSMNANKIVLKKFDRDDVINTYLNYI